MKNSRMRHLRAAAEDASDRPSIVKPIKVKLKMFCNTFKAIF